MENYFQRFYLYTQIFINCFYKYFTLYLNKKNVNKIILNGSLKTSVASIEVGEILGKKVNYFKNIKANNLSYLQAATFRQRRM